MLWPGCCRFTKQLNELGLSGTLRFLGCCRCSRVCFLCSSRCRRPLYSSWFSSSVWCCSRISSVRSFWSICSCRRSRSCVDSSCRIIRACSISFWVLFLFSSWESPSKCHSSGRHICTVWLHIPICRVRTYLSHLLLLKLMPPDQTPAFEGPAAPVVHQSLLGQQMSLLLCLRALHCFFVPGKTLLLLFLGCAGVFAHLLKTTEQGERSESSLSNRYDALHHRLVLDIYFFDLVFAKPVLLLLIL